MKILGVILAYNEADCIRIAMAQLVRYCDEVIVFDHESTDGTSGIIDNFPGVDRFALDRSVYPAVDQNGRQSRLPWRFVADRILRKQLHFDWVVWLDADEILRTAGGRIPTKQDFEVCASRGIQVIRPLIREFRMTEADSPGNSYLSRLRYFKNNALGHAPRAWQIDLTPLDIPPGRHIQDPTTEPRVHPFYRYWPEGTLVSNNVWLLDHYPFRSDDQATRKVLHDRDWITPLGQRKYYNYMKGERVNTLRNSKGCEFVERFPEMPIDSV